MTKVLILVGRRIPQEHVETYKKILREVFPEREIQDRTGDDWYDVHDLIKKSRPHTMVLCEPKTIADTQLIREAVNILWFQPKGKSPDRLHHKDYNKVVRVVWQAEPEIELVELVGEEFPPRFERCPVGA